MQKCHKAYVYLMDIYRTILVFVAFFAADSHCHSVSVDNEVSAIRKNIINRLKKIM